MRNLFFPFLILTFNVLAQDNLPNLFDYEKGARVVEVSSNYGGSWDVQSLLEHIPDIGDGELPVWCTNGGDAFPHYAIIELPQIEWMNTIRFNNAIDDEERGYPGIAAKDIEVYVSNTSSNSNFKKILSLRLENNKNNQVMKFTPIQGKWVKIVILSNYGNEFYTEMGQLGLYDDKVRQGDFSKEFTEKGFINLYGIYFDFGSSTIKPESKESITQIVDFLRKNPFPIEIEGHTDNIGNNESNQKLSVQRAEAVKAELIKQGVDAKLLSSKGLGSSQPIAENKTDWGRAQNRRVTLRKK
jgi:outer membrane protein OmpA-like peptidoglycan-associated protein